jgi:hypothetical protein
MIAETALNFSVPATRQISNRIDSQVAGNAPSDLIRSTAAILSFSFLEDTQSTTTTGLNPFSTRSITVCITHTCASIPAMMTNFRFIFRRFAMTWLSSQHENDIFSTGLDPGSRSATGLIVSPNPLLYCSVKRIGTPRAFKPEISFFTFSSKLS